MNVTCATYQGRKAERAGNTIIRISCDPAAGWKDEIEDILTNNCMTWVGEGGLTRKSSS